LETQQDADQTEDASEQVHDAPAVLEAGASDGKRQAHGQRRRRCCQPEAKPDAQHRTQCREKKDQRSVTRPPLLRRHFVDVSVDDREVGTDTDAGNCPRSDEPGVIINHGRED
jgi:hypothetical protein